MMKKQIIPFLCFVFLICSCAIKNDIPYPIIEAEILSMEVEGQCASPSGGSTQTAINKKERTVTLYVDDTVDLANLKINRLTFTEEALLHPDSTVCQNYHKFPQTGFESLDDLPVSTNSRMNFTNPVKFTLSTYQDYLWTVTVKQILERDFELQNQVGKPVIDETSRQVIIYVAEEQPLNAIKVSKFDLGGEHGSVEPDPMASPTFDFSSPVSFQVRRGWEEVYTKWTVFVQHVASGSQSSEATIFPMATSALLSGSVQSGKSVSIEYKKKSATSWTSLSSAYITVKGTSYSATLSGLSVGTNYNLRVNVGSETGTEQSFTTTQAVTLENGSLEDWNQVGNQWNPWSSGGNSFWNTGNKGTAIIGASVTTPVSESVSGKAALLASRYVALKGLAAGNLFTGDFQLSGLNGILTLGREFTSFPTSLTFYCKYITSKITRTVSRYESLKGEDDMCHIYIALTTDKVIINTANEDAFDKDGSSVIAYGEFISNKDVSGTEVNGYKKIDIPLEYKKKGVAPKYIIIVCTSSRYGDFFTGGEESKLWLDEMRLNYE